MLLTLERHQRRSSSHTNHITRAGTPPRHPRKHATRATQASLNNSPFLKLWSSLSSYFWTLLFNQIFLIFLDVLYFLSFLKTSSISETFSYFLVKVSVVIRKSQMSMSQFLAWGYLQRFNIASPGSDNLRKKGCQKSKEFRFWFVF